MLVTREDATALIAVGEIDMLAYCEADTPFVEAELHATAEVDWPLSRSATGPASASDVLSIPLALSHTPDAL